MAAMLAFFCCAISLNAVAQTQFYTTGSARGGSFMPKVDAKFAQQEEKLRVHGDEIAKNRSDIEAAQLTCEDGNYLQWDERSYSWSCVKERDPKIGNMYTNKWCRESNGKIVCDQSDPQVDVEINVQDFAKKSYTFSGCAQGQVLTTNGSGSQLVCVEDAGGETAELKLDDLTDVSVSGATGGRFLYFNGSKWVPQIENDPTVQEFAKDDYLLTPCAEGYVISAMTHPEGTRLYCVPDAGGSENKLALGDLSDVLFDPDNPPVANNVLAFDGTNWTNAVETDPTVRPLAKLGYEFTACAADEYLTTNADGSQFACRAEPSISFTEVDPTVETFAKTVLPACTAGQVLTGAGGVLSCVNDAGGNLAALNLNDLGDVSAAAPSAADVLKYVGGTWVATPETDPTVKTFAQTDLPTCAANEVLKSDGTTFSCVFDSGADGSGGYWTANGSDIYFNTGNVGIGLDTPTASLSIQSNGNTAATSALNALNSDGNVLLNIADNGAVGLGTAATDARLTLRALNAVSTSVVTNMTNSSGDSLLKLLADGRLGVGMDVTATLKMAVNGRLGAMEYCDETGTNCTTAADIANAVAGGTNLWTDNTTYISRSGFHVVNSAETTLPAALLAAGNVGYYMPNRNAFRAVNQVSTLSDDTSIAAHSAAFGQSTASGIYSFATGQGRAMASYAAALGQGNAYSTHGFAAGRSTATANYSSALGDSMAAADYAFAAGSGEASGLYAAAVGDSRAVSPYSFAAGEGLAASDYAAAFGQASAVGNNSFATGSSGANAEFSTAVGSSTASSPHSTAMGESTANGNHAFAVGNSQANAPYSTAVGQSMANGDLSFAAGASRANAPYSTASGATTASGPYSFTAGQAVTLNGTNSVAFGLDSTARTIVASNTFAIVGGQTVMGDISPSADLTLDVEGKIGAIEYCDETGANCTTAADIANAAAGGANLWTDNTTYISRSGFHVINSAETTLPAALLAAGNVAYYMPNRNAFRAVNQSAPLADDTTIGSNSAAFGAGVASGTYSFATGAAIAAGPYSFATGQGINVTGSNSVGFGLDTTTRTLSQDNTLAIVGGQVAIGSTSAASKTVLDVAGLVKIGSNDAESCDATHYGTMRWNTATNRMQICRP